MIVLLSALPALQMGREPLVTFEYLDAVLRVIHLEEATDGELVLVTKPLRLSFRDLVCLQISLLGRITSRAYLHLSDGRRIRLNVLVESDGTTSSDRTIVLRSVPEGKIVKKEYREARLCARV